jgi:DeoR family transcriptional regulator, suf operon transcriptional repressor
MTDTMIVPTAEPTKEKILRALRTNGHMTVLELVRDLRITHIAVRYHLSSLQADGMIEGREERHGIGRPHRIYRLTETALDRNPSKYYKFTNILLDQLNENLPSKTVEGLLLGVASSIAGEWKLELDPLPWPRRINRLVQLLSQDGFVTRVEASGPDQYRLLEFTCPYSRISAHHPEICALDASIFSRALGALVERTSCIRTGAEICTFSITGASRQGAND